MNDTLLIIILCILFSAVAILYGRMVLIWRDVMIHRSHTIKKQADRLSQAEIKVDFRIKDGNVCMPIDGNYIAIRPATEVDHETIRDLGISSKIEEELKEASKAIKAIKVKKIKV